jgi:hypothetical protein
MFAFRLQHPDGTADDPPTFRTSVPNWAAGDTIPLSAARMLRVVQVRDDDADQPRVLVVEDTFE